MCQHLVIFLCDDIKTVDMVIKMSNYNYSFNPNAFEILFSTPNDPNSRRNLVPYGLGYTYQCPLPIKPFPVNEVTLSQSGYNYKPELDTMCFEEPTITPYELSKIAINRRFCYNRRKGFTNRLCGK